MSTHKYIDRLCAAALVLCLLLTAAFLNGEALGIRRVFVVDPYDLKAVEERLKEEDDGQKDGTLPQA